MTSPFAVYIMEKPIFVVLRKYFRLVDGVHTPFCPAGSDIAVFASFEEAKVSVMRWAVDMGKEQHVLCDWGELPRPACECDELVFSVSVSHCFTQVFANVGADILQKYVL